MEEDDLSAPAATDISIRKVNKLKAIVRNLLYANAGRTITRRDIDKVLPGTSGTENEKQVCLQIASFLLPYMPEKDKYFVMSRQLPFILMANDILKCTGYSKFSMKVTPMSRPSDLHALKLDAPTIYTICCTSPEENNMILYDFDGAEINNRQKSTDSKLAVFSSFFDIHKLYTTCNKYGMNFIYNMYIIPGLKTVRVNGEVKKPKGSGAPPSVPTTAASKKKKKKPSTPPPRKSEQRKVIETEIEALKRQLLGAQANLKEFYEQQLNIRDVKKTWIHKKTKKELSEEGLTYQQSQTELSEEELLHNETVYQRVQQLKQERNDINAIILDGKQQLALCRQRLYLETTDTTEENNVQKRTIDRENYKCIGRDKDFEIDKAF